MVLKREEKCVTKGNEFENDVKTYGTETGLMPTISERQFENDVKTYGTETHFSATFPSFKFENDVKTYGTETTALFLHIHRQV